MDEQSGGCCTVNSGGSSQEFLISGFGSSDGHSKEILGDVGRGTDDGRGGRDEGESFRKGGDLNRSRDGSCCC